MAAPTETEVVLNNNNVPQTRAITANGLANEESVTINGAPRVYDPLPLDDATPEELAEHIGFDLAGFFVTMRKESERLKTFLYGEWPVSFLRPQDLAKAGFFYLQNGDRVQCAFCRGVVCKWDQDDIPLVEHARHYPRCPFIVGYDVGNVPIGRDPVRDEKLVRPGRDVCGSHHSAPQRNGIVKPEIIRIPSSSSLKEYGIQVYQKPMHEKFVTTESRVNSFRDTKLLKYSPKELAHSGFFFTDGRLVCAFCGIRATEKDFSLNPWEEHARRQPECYFIQINKGPRFIEACLQIPLEQIPESTKSGDKSPALSDGEVKIENGAVVSCDTNGNLENKPETTGDAEKKAEKASTNEEAPKEKDPDTTPKENKTLTVVVNNAVPIPQGKASPEAPLEGATASIESAPSSPESISPLSSLETVPSLLQKDERLLCKVCLDSEVGVVFLPCSHLVACTACAAVTSNCPICRKEIKALVRTFFT